MRIRTTLDRPRDSAHFAAPMHALPVALPAPAARASRDPHAVT